MKTALEIVVARTSYEADMMKQVANIAHINAGMYQKEYNRAKLKLQREEKRLKLAIKKEYDTALQSVQLEIIARSAAEANLR